MSTFSISDRGLLIKRDCPAQALDDVAARRRAVARTLEILHPVVRPLALEITLGPLDPQTFAVAPAESRRIASRAIPAGVTNQSAFEQPAEIELVDDLTADVVLRALTPAQPGWDFSTITASVTAARITASELTIDRMPAHRVPVLVLDGERWAVGPIDVQGYRLEPPIAVSWRQEWGNVELAIEALWSLWWQTDSAELAGLRAAERALDIAGFSQQPRQLLNLPVFVDARSLQLRQLQRYFDRIMQLGIAAPRAMAEVSSYANTLVGAVRDWGEDAYHPR